MYTIQKKIYLIGFMGSGKSTIGKQLSEALGIKFVDLDAIIEEKENRKIAEIFKTEGEQYFRNLETEALKELLYESPLIISLGGGTPCFNGNMGLLNNTGTTIYLKVDPEQLTDRLISEKNHRPIIAAAEDKCSLKELITIKLTKRGKYYESAHHTIINTSEENSIREITDLIAS